MKLLCRLVLVAAIAAGLVTLTVHLERRYAPQTASHWREFLWPTRGPNTPSPPGSQSRGFENAPDQDELSWDADSPSAACLADRSWNRGGELRRADAQTHLAQLHGGPAIGAADWPCCGVSGSDPGSADTPVATTAAAVAQGLVLPGRFVELTPATLLGRLESSPSHAPSDVAQDATDRSTGRRQPEPGAIQPLGLVQDLPETARREGHNGPAANGPAVNELAGVESVELMRQLHAADGQLAARARTELLRRGLSEVDLDLARRLFDPDAEVRKELARQLPRLQSVDAGPWLLFLCHDEQAEVRLTAITLVATSGDPALLEQVEQLAQRDPDARIRDQAERISRQRERVGSQGSQPSRHRMR
jgi:hypothetical protein